MRLVFVNHCHPDTPHVCATRVREFAAACARLGHQVVLLTETLPGRSDDVVPPAGLAARLAAHDWRQPFRLPCRPVRRPLLVAAREGRLPGFLRRPVLAASYLLRGGVFTDWRDGSRPTWPILAGAFRPQAVWATFGNTDALLIARGIARAAECAWVMDVKDPFSAFIPRPLRRIVRTRLGAPAAVTALSRGHGDDTLAFLGRESTVVASGIDAALLVPRPAAPVPPAPVLLLVGGLYDRADLESLVEGVRRWLEGLAPARRGQAAVVYAGGEGTTFRAAATTLAGLARVEAAGYVPLDSLATLAAGALATLFVRSRRALYQHKLLELAAMGRPMICLPPESSEAMDIAGRVGAPLYGCRDADAVRAALDTVWRSPPAPPPDPAALAEYGWDAQARRLMAVLEKVGR